MNDRKIIAITGATGAQGGGLVQAILNDPSGGFVPRAITRNTGSEKARALESRGAEVVQADLDDPGSVEAAFSGAHGAFCLTSFWEHFSPEKEIEQAHTMAQAAKATGLKHVIWSTLEDTRQWVPLDDERMPTLMEKYKVPHFDGKGEANSHFTELDLPVTFLLTSFYWDNFIHFGLGPKKSPDGKLAITLPMGDRKLPGIAAEDIGKCAYGIFKKGPELAGKTIGIAGEHNTGAEIATILSRALGQEIRYNAVPPEAYRGFGFPGADDLANMFQFKHDFEDYFCSARDPKVARSLNPEMQTLADWAERNKDRIPIE